MPGEVLGARRDQIVLATKFDDAAIGGLAAQPGCASVIAGATSPDQVKGNVAAADWIPAAAGLAELDQLVPPPGH